MTLPMESSLVEAPTMATDLGLKSASNMLFPLLKLFDECFHIGPGLLVGHTAQVVQVAGDDQAGDTGLFLQPLRQSVAAVGVAGTGLGVMVDDPVDPELLQHLPEIR